MSQLTALDGVQQLHKFTVDGLRLECLWDPGSTTVHLRARGAAGAQIVFGFLSMQTPRCPQLTVFSQYQAWIGQADHRWGVVCREAQHAYLMRIELLATAYAQPWQGRGEGAT